MYTLYCKGKTTQQVIDELSARNRDEEMILVTWNGNTYTDLAGAHLAIMKRLQQEERIMS